MTDKVSTTTEYSQNSALNNLTEFLVANCEEGEEARTFIRKTLDENETVKFCRTKDNAKEWQKLLNALHKQEITDNNDLHQKLNPHFLRIDHEFLFQRASADGYFNPFHVEQLLDQTSDILDRALRDRREWDESADKWVTLLLELFEYEKLDKIHTEEESTGIYKLPFENSSSSYRAESGKRFYQSKIEAILQQHLDEDLKPETLNALQQSAQLASWLSGVVPWTWRNQEFAGYVSYNFDDEDATVAKHAQNASVLPTINRLREQFISNVVALVGHRNQKGISGALLEGLAAQVRWDAQNVSFQKRRTLVAREMQDIKMKLALSNDGLLNSGKRLTSLRARFLADFRDAFARLRAAQSGLKRVFGFDLPLPDPNSSDSPLDECLLWTRHAVQAVISFSQRDQSVVLPISIRALVGETSWEQGRTNGTWKVNLSDVFPDDMRHLRLRGVSVTTSDKHQDQLWHVKIFPPHTGTLRLLDGSEVAVDQKESRPVRIGRCTGRNNARAPDIAGLSTLHNLTPLGEWSIEVVGNSSGSSKCDLENIEVYIHCVYHQN